jgi:hypothetical protein
MSIKYIEEIMSINLYEAKPLSSIGQPYLLISTHETVNNYIADIFSILRKNDDKTKVKGKRFKYQKDVNLLAIFPDINTLIEKDIVN